MNLDDNFGKETKNTLQKPTEDIIPSKGFKGNVDKALLKCYPQLRKKIAVIFGGCSSEYRVSLESAYAIITHINKEKYSPILIGISSRGDWFKFNGDIEKIIADTWCNTSDCTPVLVSLNKTERNLLILNNNKIEKIHIDAAFPVLHGKNGEDGTVQGLFELAGIPIVGCGTLSSALCMDKDRAHKLVHIAGITT